MLTVLAGIIPQQPSATAASTNHHLATMINDPGLHPPLPASTSSNNSSPVGGNGGHNINSIMTPPDAHPTSTSSTSSTAQYNAQSEDKYSMVSFTLSL